MTVENENENGTPDGRALVALDGTDGTRVWLATDALMAVVALDADPMGETRVEGSRIFLTGGVELQVLGDPDTVIGMMSGRLDSNGYDRTLGYGDGDGDGISA